MVWAKHSRTRGDCISTGSGICDAALRLGAHRRSCSSRFWILGKMGAESSNSPGAFLKHTLDERERLLKLLLVGGRDIAS